MKNPCTHCGDAGIVDHPDDLRMIGNIPITPAHARRRIPCPVCQKQEDIKTKYKVGDFIVGTKHGQVNEVISIEERGIVAWLVYPQRSHQHLIEWDWLRDNYQPLPPNADIQGGYIKGYGYNDGKSCRKSNFPDGPTMYDKMVMNKVRMKVDGD